MISSIIVIRPHESVAFFLTCLFNTCHMHLPSRRRALKSLVFASAGMVLIPSCMSDRSKSSLLLKKIKITADDEALMAELCETILPKTNTPGAKDLSAHLFVLMMVDDCRKKEDQDKFIKGLEAFKKFSKQTINKDFVKADPVERKRLLDGIIAKMDEENDLNAFFKMTKGLTIQAYTSSEFYLTNVQVYELVPGRYHGCVPA